MEVGVRVEAENPISGEIRHTNSAYITMVAVDEDGHPVAAVPNLRCESPDELRRERDAQVRRANRLAEREQLLEHEVEGKGAQPA
jgi:acyl-CoA hydrolase